jgi:hypothetical protein
VSEPYEESVAGETLLRLPPDTRHEQVCARLHQFVAASAAAITVMRLLPCREGVRLAADTLVRPDLALLTAANGRLWLAAEIISAEDHQCDTVTKKALYEDANIPRLWMLDLRYDNVEVYHSSPYGLRLQRILAGRERLTEKLLPQFELVVQELFQPEP